MKDENNALVSLLFIDDDGVKKIMGGGVATGSFCPLGDLTTGNNTILVCEG